MGDQYISKEEYKLLTFTESLLHVRQYTKHFTGIISFQPPKNIMEWAILLDMYWSNISHIKHMSCSWNVERFSHLPKVIWPASDHAKM